MCEWFTEASRNIAPLAEFTTAAFSLNAGTPTDSGGVLLSRNYFHFLPVVGELFAAVQADDVSCLGVFPFGRKPPRLLESYREAAVMVSTTEQRSDEPKHLIPLWRVFLPSVASMLDEVELRMVGKVATTPFRRHYFVTRWELMVSLEWQKVYTACSSPATPVEWSSAKSCRGDTTLTELLGIYSHNCSTTRRFSARSAAFSLGCSPS
jgi:hypothetical protein